MFVSRVGLVRAQAEKKPCGIFNGRLVRMRLAALLDVFLAMTLTNWPPANARITSSRKLRRAVRALKGRTPLDVTRDGCRSSRSRTF